MVFFASIESVDIKYLLNNNFEYDTTTQNDRPHWKPAQ
jgi:hypothetical protein